MPWFVFAIAATVLYGTSNFFDKYLIEKRVRDPMLLTVLGGCIAFCFGLGIWIIQHFPTLTFAQGLTLIISGCLFQWALVPYYKALQHEDTSRIAPLFQVIPMLALILSAIFLGEQLGNAQLLGFFAIFLGGLVLSIEKFDQTILRVRKAFWLMMLSSALFVLPIVMFKSVVINQSLWDALPFEFFGGFIGGAALLLLPNIRKSIRRELPAVPRKTWWPIVINECIYILGKICTFTATSLAAVSLVTVYGGLQPFFVLLLGYVLTRLFPKVIQEDIRQKTIAVKILAIVVIFVGVWLTNR